MGECSRWSCWQRGGRQVGWPRIGVRSLERVGGEDGSVAVKISLARALGTCFGVRDAIEAALDPSFRDNLTILGQLVHNPQTVEELRANGVKLVDSLDDEIETRNVMITAHGSSESVKAELRKRGHQVFDASCPLVLKVHNRVAKLVRDGYFPVVIGERNHVEVRGIVGDLEEYAVIGEPSEVSLLEGQSKIGIVCQTTHQVEDARAVIRAIEERFPQTEICFVDTICKPTKERQLPHRGGGRSRGRVVPPGQPCRNYCRNVDSSSCH